MVVSVLDNLSVSYGLSILILYVTVGVCLALIIHCMASHFVCDCGYMFGFDYPWYGKVSL